MDLAYRAMHELVESLLICIFIVGIISIVPLIDGKALNWEQIGFIFMISSLFSFTRGLIELLRSFFHSPQAETSRAVNEVIREFRKQLHDTHAPSAQQWSSGPYHVPPPTQSRMHADPTERIPAVSFPHTTWLPEDKPTLPVPAVRPNIPQTSQQIILRPNHFHI